MEKSFRSSIIFLLSILLSSPVFATDCTHTKDKFSCVKYEGNYGGDTIRFTVPGVHHFFGKKAKVRVQGIDTAEIKPKGKPLPCEKEWARAAQKFVANELKNARRIDITKLDGHDRYGRILAQVEYDGKNLKDVLLQNHLAVPYVGKRKSKVDWCALRLKREKK